MKVSGNHLLNAPREQVWQSLNDPVFLKACLPGCESMEATAPDQYQAVLTVGIAAVKGKYTGTVTLSEKAPPERFTMQVQGRGSGGFLQGTGVLELSEDAGGTKVTYQGDVQIGGPIATVGQRLLDGAAKMMVGQFFHAVNVQLTAASAPSAEAPPTMESGHMMPPGTASSLTAMPTHISPWRAMLQYFGRQGWETLRRWFRRSAS